MRLRDVYYTDKILDGIPEPSANPVPIDFYQGEDIVFEVFLNFQNTPVSLVDWDVKAYVKKNKYAETILWQTELNNGLYKGEIEGAYKIIIPSEATSRFLAGTYWIAISIHEKAGTGPKDLDYIILNQPFGINYSAASPNPDLDLLTVERTYPPPFSADKN